MKAISESVNRRSKEETLLKRSSDSREVVMISDKMAGKSNSAFAEDLPPDPVLNASSAISGTSITSINFTEDNKENQELLNGSVLCRQKMKSMNRLRSKEETLLKRSDLIEMKSVKMTGDLPPEKNIVDYWTESEILKETWLSQVIPNPLLSPDPVLTASRSGTTSTGLSSSINFTENIDGQIFKDYDVKIPMEDFSLMPGDGKKSTSTTLALEKERKNTYFTEHSGYARSSQPRLGPSQGRSRKLPSQELGSLPRRHPPTLDTRGHRRHRHPHPRKHHYFPTSFLKLVFQWGPGVRSRKGQDTNIRARFTIHGVWENERISELSPVFYLPLEHNRELIRRASRYWPNVLVGPNSNEFPSSHDVELWTHEWTYHGRFTGKTLPEYMKFTMDWFKRIKGDAEYYLRKNSNSRRGGRLDIRRFIKDMRKKNRDASVHSTWRTYEYERDGSTSTTRYFQQQEFQEARLYCTPDSSVPVWYLPRMDASQYNRGWQDINCEGNAALKLINQINEQTQEDEVFVEVAIRDCLVLIHVCNLAWATQARLDGKVVWLSAPSWLARGCVVAGDDANPQLFLVPSVVVEAAG